MIELKPLHSGAVEKSLEKAEHYRLLNQPEEAESICMDVLAVEPDNQRALVTLILALTDQFSVSRAGAPAAKRAVKRLAGDYQRSYYRGLISERLGRAAILRSGHGSSHDAYEWLHEAMEFYAVAEGVRPEGNDDAILRWNHCARLINSHRLTARPPDDGPMLLE
jgi:hypothetical protein